MPGAFRFGLLIETASVAPDELIELARRAEGEGYSTILGTDHLGRMAPLQLLQAAAKVTSLRIGTLVLNNDFRHPAVLAQEMATLDVLTGGRVEVGLGAGWAVSEYVGAALSFDPPGRRVDRLVASIALLKQAFAEGRMERAGDDAYAPIRLEGLPRSVQRPHPPLLIGGGGRRVLSLAAREAQIVGLDPRALPEGGHDRRDVTAPLFDEKVGWIRHAAAERWEALELNIIVFGVDTAHRSGSGPSPALRHPISAEEMEGSPHYLLGDTDSMADALFARRERWGINYYAVRPDQMDALAPLVARLTGR
jgi:probable F420-dependent oxidoreductase